MRIHYSKKGIRVLAIAESFERHDKKSILAGIVMRRDLVVDGIAVTKAESKNELWEIGVEMMTIMMGNNKIIIILEFMIFLFNSYTILFIMDNV